MRASVHSLYMNNISEEMRVAQKRVVEKFLPSDFYFTQVHRDVNHHDAQAHAYALADCVKHCQTDVVMFLDIDAIPLSTYAFQYLFEAATAGILIGPAQRSLHLLNHKHVFVAMAACAFSKRCYEEAGSPYFFTTAKGDIGEELTYRWEEQGRPTHKMRPTHVEVPLWPYENDREKVYGHGCTFGGLFYHEFESSGYTGKAAEHRERFLRKCASILGE